MIVVDASIVVQWLLNGASATRVEARLFQSGETLHAPYLIDAEVTQVMRRYNAMREIDGVRGMEAVTILGELPMQRYAHGILLPRVWQLRHNLSAYDAMYVVLAELLEATLLTCDRRLAAAPGHQARIEVI